MIYLLILVKLLRHLQKAIIEISDHIKSITECLDYNSIEKVINVLIKAREKGRKILVVGAGRSGLVGKSFAMRLMHLGFNVYVVGETITPSVKEEDILIAISGSGRTQVVVTVAAAAKRMGAKIIAITSHPDSPLGRISDYMIRIPGRTKIAKEVDYFTRQVLGIYEPLAPLGTLFEDSTLVFFDGLVVELMQRLKITEADMKKRHANVEFPM
ncbi:MAG: 6-phospho-3-hexuloisomerase [Thermoprotei archaeon]|nr:MAG: 6-phospho-3-hexuloisomerase [Thermoprotei archaeon]